jgi:hypothetical protein
MSLTALPKTSKVIATVRDVVFVVEDSALNGTFIQVNNIQLALGQLYYGMAQLLTTK